MHNQDLIAPAWVTHARADFPMLQGDLVYLDNAATTLKPQAVIDRVTQVYGEDYATVNRGVYFLCQQATQAYDSVRAQVKGLINARSDREIVFTKGTTDAINLVANGVSEVWLEPGDDIIISLTEHHANLIPWQQICKKKRANLVVIPVDKHGEIDGDAYYKALSPRTKFVAVAHISNSIGVRHPIATMIQQAHAVGAYVLIDGAQGIAHEPVDVQALDCDFYCFSGHKLYGPSGVGVLYGKYDLLNQMPPYQFGGDMIDTVTLEASTFAPPPMRFEAGTPSIAAVIGLGAAITYVQSIGLVAIAAYEADLLTYALAHLNACPGVRIIGKPSAGIISFVLDGIHAHDIGSLMDVKQVAIRAGHHCAQPTMTYFGLSASARASFGLYTTPHDIDQFIHAIAYVQSVMTA